MAYSRTTDRGVVSRRPAAKPATTCRPKTCPTCGEQECLERPRFFCGQLLNDKDLDAAQRYVIEKNRLHNRYLFGSGVVCGLVVRCDPCEGVVVVEPGYAIDCCGNDIVVCDPARFDVLDYIRKCRQDDEPKCDDRIRPRPTRCDEAPREYCLVISYAEEPARPVAALTRSDGCRTERCEPSRTREVFRLDLIEEERGEERKARGGDDFWHKAAGCLREVLRLSRLFFEDFQRATGDQRDAAARHAAVLAVICRLRDDLLRLYRRGPNVRCTLAAELDAIVDAYPTSPNEEQYERKVYNALFKMYGNLLQYAIDCVCDALLVPCVSCEDDEGVVLACLTVQGGEIKKICNIARKQVLTGPALRYWLHPLFAGIHRVLEYLCCDVNLANAFDRIFRVETDRTTVDREEGETTTTQPGASTARPGAPPPTAEGSARRPEGVTTERVDASPETDSDAEARTAERSDVSSSGRSKEEFRGAAILSVFTRGEAGYKVGRDYSAAILRSLRTANLLQFANPDVVTAMDVYGLSANDAASVLKRAGVSARVQRARSREAAYNLDNLMRMTWIVPPDSTVELTVSPEDRVTAVRAVGGDDR